MNELPISSAQVSESYIEIGKIVGVWGVKGWVKLHSYTRDRADISQYQKWYLARQPKAAKGFQEAKGFQIVEVNNCRQQGPGVVAQLNGIDDRDQAAELNGLVIFVKKDDLPKLPDGEFYWQQLIGLQVANSDRDIGTVSSLLETGANDVLVVKQTEAGLEDVLIPYNKQTVREVDLEQGTMVVDWDPQFLID